jgi:hypothetical protein
MKLRSGAVIIAPPIQPKMIQKTVKKCSFCKNPGHNISVCVEKKEALIVSVLFRFINSCETKEELRDTLNQFILKKLKVLAKHFKLKSSSQRKHIIIDEVMPLCIEHQTTQWINNYEIIKEILQEHPGYSLTEIVDMKVIEIVRNIHNSNENVRQAFTSSNWFDRLRFRQQSPTIRRQIYEGYIRAFDYVTYTMNDENANYQWKIQPIMTRLYTEGELHEVKQCPICYEETPEINLMHTNCNHTFCNTCITRHLDTERNKRHPHCPMCRSTITTMNIKSIILFDEFSNRYNA